MRLMGPAAVALLLALPGTATADIKRHRTVPEAFWGQWTLIDQPCGQDGRPALAITGSSYTQPDATCAILWVDETAGRTGSIYSAHMRCTAEGGAPQSAANLILLARDGDVVALGGDFQSLRNYRRCPAERQPAPATE
ncbi:hypothetical protein [Methylobacterium isbiliense]|jgi:hypothetical protein|uniref:DUF3617 family protein n=1 Tax=Methylobacterium isbiliense TaxID=315478 RepID=A0ABQ4SLH5_9HYPH|nr:hypothetical protein [Methylobacterium isbiliense]MDN3623900.1 hypothetical protein [Methylobacterium isbiliense]GJE02753.1 hypothetical protein GMJLKIPL_4702 [Methylobacterium isbiliense]